jgi:hypothetical protein
VRVNEIALADKEIAGWETVIGRVRARIVGPPCPFIATTAALAARPRAARAG